ncbi:MAG: PqqD family protein [Actinobacteria bacterium]|nr:PqqD family protein [Actinomycetota bacterium]
MIKLNDNLQPSRDITVRSIGDEVMILTLKDTCLYSMNEVGKCIWGTLSVGPANVNAIIKSVSSEYDVEAGLIREDVLDFLNELLSKDIVEISNK